MSSSNKVNNVLISFTVSNKSFIEEGVNYEQFANRVLMKEHVCCCSTQVPQVRREILVLLDHQDHPACQVVMDSQVPQVPLVHQDQRILINLDREDHLAAPERLVTTELQVDRYLRYCIAFIQAYMYSVSRMSVDTISSNNMLDLNTHTHTHTHTHVYLKMAEEKKKV